MKKLRLLRDALLILVTITSVIAAILAIYYKASFLTVTSRSMEPTIRAGDILLTREIDKHETERNDVIVLPAPDNEKIFYSHRVIEVSNKSGDVVVTTKGDANPKRDSWQMEITSKEVPKVVAVIPTAPIFNNSIGRRAIFNFLLIGGFALFLLASWRLIARRFIRE